MAALGCGGGGHVGLEKALSEFKSTASSRMAFCAKAGPGKGWPWVCLEVR